MLHLIDKAALVAEIQKRRSEHYNHGGSPSSEYCREDDEILCIIDTLEVKDENAIKRDWYNKGYIKGRKEASIPARELGLPSALDVSLR